MVCVCVYIYVYEGGGGGGWVAVHGLGVMVLEGDRVPTFRLSNILSVKIIIKIKKLLPKTGNMLTLHFESDAAAPVKQL